MLQLDTMQLTLRLPKLILLLLFLWNQQLSIVILVFPARKIPVNSIECENAIDIFLIAYSNDILQPHTNLHLSNKGLSQLYCCFLIQPVIFTDASTLLRSDRFYRNTLAAYRVEGL